MYNCGKIKMYLWTVTAVQKNKKERNFPHENQLLNTCLPRF